MRGKVIDCGRTPLGSDQELGRISLGNAADPAGFPTLLVRIWDRPETESASIHHYRAELIRVEAPEGFLPAPPKGFSTLQRSSTQLAREWWRAFVAATRSGRVLCHPASSFFGKRKSPIRPLSPPVASAKTGRSDKTETRQLFTVMSGHARTVSDALCNLLHRQPRIILHEMAQDLSLCIGQLSDWLRVLKLLAKLHILDLKTRYLRLKTQSLLRKHRILLNDQRQLLLKQVNHVFGKPVRVGDANNLPGDVGSTHGVFRPDGD